MVRGTQIYKPLLVPIMTPLVLVLLTNLVSIGVAVDKLKTETFLALKLPYFIIDKLIQSTLE
jgi:hypothetical protein